jgi:hypothetical protein
LCVDGVCRQERRFRGYKELIRQLPIVGRKVNDSQLDPSELCKIYTAVATFSLLSYYKLLD